jgi:hypothetical protein
MALPLPLARQLLLAATDGGGMGDILVLCISLYKKWWAQRVPAEKLQKINSTIHYKPARFFDM